MNSIQQTFFIPADYVEQSTDIIGFWPGQSPIHMVPLNVKLLDNKIDSRKTSVLITGRLVDNCDLIDSDDQPILGKKDDLVGVWYKPGMKAIVELGGVKTLIIPNGEKDIGKGSPMKLFRVLSKTKGSRLPIEADYRTTSKNDITPFTTGTNNVDSDDTELVPYF